MDSTINVYRQGVFTLGAFEDAPENNYAGVTNGVTWNGWETPLFTREQGERIAASFLKEDGCTIRYDEARDAFVYEVCAHKRPNGHDCDNQQEEPEVFEGITLPGLAGRYYAIGAWSWTWDEVEP